MRPYSASRAAMQAPSMASLSPIPLSPGSPDLFRKVMGDDMLYLPTLPPHPAPARPTLACPALAYPAPVCPTAYRLAPLVKFSEFVRGKRRHTQILDRVRRGPCLHDIGTGNVCSVRFDACTLKGGVRKIMPAPPPCGTFGFARHYCVSFACSGTFR